MAVAYTDSLGPVFDTGSNSIPTVRGNTEQEFHTSLETDTGSKLVATSQPNIHSPHRALTSPR